MTHMESLKMVNVEYFILEKLCCKTYRSFVFYLKRCPVCKQKNCLNWTLFTWCEKLYLWIIHSFHSLLWLGVLKSEKVIIFHVLKMNYILVWYLM